MKTLQGVAAPDRRQPRPLENVGQLCTQLVDEQRVDDLVDVLRAGVVHPAGTAGLWIQRRFENAAEDGGGDLRPVGLHRHFVDQQVKNFFGKWRHFGGALKQAAIDVGERLQVIAQIWVAVHDRSVQDLEQLLQRRARHWGGHVLQVRVQRVFREQSRILGEEAEHQTDTQNIERVLAFIAVRVEVLASKQVVQLADERTGVHRRRFFALLA